MNRAAKRARQNRWYAKRRALMLAHLGGACAECGGTEGLEIDHVDPVAKCHDPMRLWSRAWATVVAALEGCQALCHACHAAKTARWMRERRALWKALQARNRADPVPF